MPERSDLEKKGVVLDGALTDDRSTTEGQMFDPEVLHTGLNSERRYGECGCDVSI